MEVVYVDERWLCWEGASAHPGQCITVVNQRRKLVVRVRLLTCVEVTHINFLVSKACLWLGSFCMSLHRARADERE